MSKNIDWDNLGFGYVETDYRYLTTYKDGKWDEGGLITDANVVLNECAGVFQYAQTVFEGLKAYYTKDGHIVCFRPDLNAERLNQSCERLVMPTLPEGRFLEAVKEVVKANKDFVPPYGHGASLYIRPYMMGTNSVIGVKPADLPFVFEKGFSGDNQEVNKKTTGMGLYLVRELAKSLNLGCQAQSEYGKGFGVELRFPVV